jgi:hypothetical protein
MTGDAGKVTISFAEWTEETPPRGREDGISEDELESLKEGILRLAASTAEGPPGRSPGGDVAGAPPDVDAWDAARPSRAKP